MVCAEQFYPLDELTSSQVNSINSEQCGRSDVDKTSDVSGPKVFGHARKRAIVAWFIVGSLLPACSSPPSLDGTTDRAEVFEELVIYSPAPPTIMLHEHNAALGDALQTCGVAASVRVVPMALPASINAINALDPSVKPFHLPIVTTLDFQPAIDATAPAWHGYDKANKDLKFVGSLYEVAYGVMVFDPAIEGPADLAGKRVAVPARPSAVRWFSEVLLQEGWSLSDEVVLVDTIPPEVPGGLAEGSLDAVAWNIMSETPSGYMPLLPMLIGQENARWLDVDETALGAINQGSPFSTELVRVNTARVPGGDATNSEEIKLLSFRQALAAWESTPDDLVEGVVQCLAETDLPFGSPAGFSADQFKWPGLADDHTHKAALRGN